MRKIGQGEAIMFFRVVVIVIGILIFVQGISGLSDLIGGDIAGTLVRWTSNIIKVIFGFALVVLGISPESLVMIIKATVP